MKFARRPRMELDVNLTPLIDVVFLLLIFFMVSTTFIKDSHLSITLPEANGTVTTVSKKHIDITISKSGQFAINDVPLANSTLSTLKRALEKVSEGDTKIPLTITADATTQHQAVVTAMDAAGQLGFVELSIATRNLQTGQDEDKQQ